MPEANPAWIVVIGLYLAAETLPIGLRALARLDRWMAGDRWESEQEQDSDPVAHNIHTCEECRRRGLCSLAESGEW